MTTAPGLRLGVLDLWDLSTAATVELCKHAEQLGYSRYWMTEHDNPPQPRPQALLGYLAGATARIRVGTGGVRLHVHDPLQTAHDFLLLESFFPGRIDAGFSSAGGAGRPPEEYAARVREITGYLRGDLPADHPAAAVPVWRKGLTSTPEVWCLGNGERSMRIAARHGLAFGYSLLHSDGRPDSKLVARYRDEFRPSRSRPEPLVVLAVSAICAEDGDRARRLAAEREAESLTLNVAGAPAECRDRLIELATQVGTADLLILDGCQTYEDRRRSLELLGEALGLA
jgi:luciferase family oxidoreductase group 1